MSSIKFLSRAMGLPLVLSAALVGCNPGANTTSSAPVAPAASTAPAASAAPAAAPSNAVSAPAQTAPASAAIPQSASNALATASQPARPSQKANASCEVTGIANDYYGDCVFSQYGGNGSFTIEAPSGLIGDVQAVSVDIFEEGVAEVAILTYRTQTEVIGNAWRMESDPACWKGENDSFEICAR